MMGTAQRIAEGAHVICWLAKFLPEASLSPVDPDEFIRIMSANLRGVEAQCDEVFALMDALPEHDACRPMLLKVHEGLSNIVGTTKANLAKVKALSA
jgi:hypothetical protein